MDGGGAEAADGGAVGDENHGLVLAVVEEAAKEFALGLLVQGRADFIEQQDATRAQQTTGNGDALGLAFAETNASLTQ